MQIAVVARWRDVIFDIYDYIASRRCKCQHGFFAMPFNQITKPFNSLRFA